MPKRSEFEEERPVVAPAAPSPVTLSQKEEAYRVAAEGGKVSRKDLEAMRTEMRALRDLLAKSR